MSDLAQGSADSADEKPVDIVEEKQTVEEMVSKKQFNALLDEMMKHKKLSQQHDAALKQRDMEDLKKKDEWQKVAEIREGESNSYKEEIDLLRSAAISERKHAVIKDIAIRLGMKDKTALEDLFRYDFNDVAIETTSEGRINVLGAETSVKNLKASRPWLFTGKSVNVNSGLPEEIGSRQVTMKDVFTAEKKAKESGDYAPYTQVLKQYQQQG